MDNDTITIDSSDDSSNSDVDPHSTDLKIESDDGESSNLQEAYSLNEYSPISESNNLVKYYRNDTQYSVKVVDSDGNPKAGEIVSFNIIGKIYDIACDENGIATLNINLNPGNYIITAIDSTNGLQRSFNIKVLSIIKTQDVTMTVSKRVPFTATVLDEQGNLASNRQVSFNVNGKIYTGVSDVNGVASLSLNLPQGRYIVTTMYNGEYTSNTVQINGN